MHFEKLLQLADKAKNASCYQVANVITAILFQAALRMPADEDRADGPPELWFEVETDDVTGQDTQASHYDVVKVVHWSGSGLLSLGIPVTFLRDDTARAIYKRAGFEERAPHDRNVRPDSVAARELWAELAEEVNCHAAARAVSAIFDEVNGHKEPFRAELLELINQHLPKPIEE